MTPAEFRKWADEGEPGDTIVYHYGFLAADRTKHKGIHVLAQVATEYSDKGRVQLWQNRGVENRWYYIAEIREPRAVAAPPPAARMVGSAYGWRNRVSGRV